MPCLIVERRRQGWYGTSRNILEHMLWTSYRQILCYMVAEFVGRKPAKAMTSYITSLIGENDSY